MFRLFPLSLKETIIEIFNKTSHEDQAKLAQVNKQFNEILKDKSLELEKYKSKCTVHSIGHTHIILQKESTSPFFFSFYAMKYNKKVFEYQVGCFLAMEFRIAMKGPTSSVINQFQTMGCDNIKKITLFLQEALEEENQSICKNKK